MPLVELVSFTLMSRLCIKLTVAAVHARPDPFTFALFRFALLLFPLTSAAPSSLVDALEMSGDLQGRALGAGLLAMLLLAERLQQ